MNLKGATINLRWTTASGQVTSKTVRGTGYDPRFGRDRGLNPGLQGIKADVGRISMARGSYYMVTVSNVWGATNPFYSSSG